MSDEPQALAARIDSVTPWWLFAFLAALAVTVAAMVAMTHRVRVSVDELRAQQTVLCEVPQAATVPESVPEPVTTRARRAAPRTTAARAGADSSMALTAPQPATAPSKQWGTTDLDREIAAFPSTSLEQSK